MACFILCIQAAEDRPVPKAIKAKIKATCLLFSCHPLQARNMYFNIFLFNTFSEEVKTSGKHDQDGRE